MDPEPDPSIQGVFRGDGIQLFGLDAELELKAQSKRNIAVEKELMDWISLVTGDKMEFPDDLSESLKSGITLCKLVNIVKPGTIKVYNTKRIPLLEMENIGFYLKACWHLGVPSSDLFVTSDLYLKKSIPSVVQNILSFARLASSVETFEGPYFRGMKPTKPVAQAKKWNKIKAGGGPVYAVDLKAKYEKEKAEFDQFRARISKETQELQAKITLKEQEIEKIIKEIGQAKEQLEKKRKECIEEKKNSERDLQNQKALLEKQKQQQEKDQQDFQKKQQQEKSQQENLKKKEEEQKIGVQKQYEQKLAQAEEKVNKFIAEGEKDKVTAETKVQTLSKELEKIKQDERNVTNEYNQAQEKEKSLIRQIDQINASVNQQSGDNSSVQKALETEVQTIQQQIREKETVLNKLTKEKEQAVATINKLKETETANQNKLNSQREKEKNLTQEIEKLRQKSDELNDEKRKLQRELTAQKAEQENITKKLERRKEDEKASASNQEKEKILQKQRILNQVEEAVEAEKRKGEREKEAMVDRFEKELTSLRRELAREKERKADIQVEFDNAKSTGESLQKTKQDLETKRKAAASGGTGSGTGVSEGDKRRDAGRSGTWRYSVSATKGTITAATLSNRDVQKLNSEIAEIKAKLQARSQLPVTPEPVPEPQPTPPPEEVEEEEEEEEEEMGEPFKVGGREVAVGGTITRRRPRASVIGQNPFQVAVQENLAFARGVLSKILFSQPVDDEDVIKFNVMLKSDEGRRAFVKVLKQTTKEVPTLVLKEDSFDLLLFLLNTTIYNMTTTQSEDLFGLKIIFFASLVISRQTATGAREYLKDFVSTHSVWQEAKFWEESFWGELSKRYRDRKEEDPTTELDDEFTLSVILSYAQLMYRWPVPEEMIWQFGKSICLVNKIHFPHFEERFKEMINEEIKLERKTTKSQITTKSSSKITACAKGHNFVKPPNQFKPTICDECKSTIWRINKNIQYCKDCGYMAHQKCRRQGSFTKLA